MHLIGQEGLDDWAVPGQGLIPDLVRQFVADFPNKRPHQGAANLPVLGSPTMKECLYAGIGWARG